MIFASARRFSLFAAALVVAGCAVPADWRHGYRPLSTEDGLIAFDAPAFTSRQPARVLFADRLQREEYARFQGGGAQAEIIYLSIRRHLSPRAVLNGVPGLDGMLESWRYLGGRLGEAHEAAARNTEWFKVWYKTFHLSGSGRACMGFRAEWDNNSWDRLNRPTQAVFGYYCAKPGMDISMADAGALVEGFGIRGVTQRLSGQSVAITAVPPSPSQVELAALAQASRGGSLGASQFPLRWATIFSPDGGSDTVVP